MDTAKKMYYLEIANNITNNDKNGEETRRSINSKFKEYENILEKADYLINQIIDQGTIDNDLNKIQKKLENELK